MDDDEGMVLQSHFARPCRLLPMTESGAYVEKYQDLKNAVVTETLCDWVEGVRLRYNNVRNSVKV